MEDCTRLAPHLLLIYFLSSLSLFLIEFSETLKARACVIALARGFFHLFAKHVLPADCGKFTDVCVTFNHRDYQFSVEELKLLHDKKMSQQSTNNSQLNYCEADLQDAVNRSGQSYKSQMSDYSTCNFGSIPKDSESDIAQIIQQLMSCNQPPRQSHQAQKPTFAKQPAGSKQQPPVQLPSKQYHLPQSYKVAPALQQKQMSPGMKNLSTMNNSNGKNNNYSLNAGNQLSTYQKVGLAPNLKAHTAAYAHYKPSCSSVNSSPKSAASNLQKQEYNSIRIQQPTVLVNNQNQLQENINANNYTSANKIQNLYQKGFAQQQKAHQVQNNTLEPQPASQTYCHRFQPGSTQKENTCLIREIPYQLTAKHQGATKVSHHSYNPSLNGAGLNLVSPQGSPLRQINANQSLKKPRNSPRNSQEADAIAGTQHLKSFSLSKQRYVSNAAQPENNVTPHAQQMKVVQYPVQGSYIPAGHFGTPKQKEFPSPKCGQQAQGQRAPAQQAQGKQTAPTQLPPKVLEHRNRSITPCNAKPASQLASNQ